MLASLLILIPFLPIIWIVDAANGPGTNFTDLPAAVAAAASGDTIIVRPGTYTWFSVTGKALTIRGESKQTTIVANPPPGGYPPLPPPGGSLPANIASVPAGTTFYLSGMTMAPAAAPSSTPTAGLRITGPGKVVLTDLVIQCPGGSSPGVPGLDVTAFAELHASRCSFTGAPNGGTGAGIGDHSEAAFDDSIFQGYGGFYAGRGLVVSGSNVLLHRSSVYGATGNYSAHGLAVTPHLPTSYPGFVRISGTVADVLAAGSTPNPLNAGVPVSVGSSCSVVIHGPVTLIPAMPGGPLLSGSVQIGAPPLPYLSVTGMTTPGGAMLASQSVTLTIDGAVPSAPYILAFDLAPGFTTIGAPLLGPVLVPLPPTGFFEGTLNGAGIVQSTVTAPVLPPSLLGVPLYAQVGVVAGAADVRLSNGWIRLFTP